jgi:hypothetical protein
MEQTAKLPSKRIVFSQSYDYIFEMLMPGKSWADYGITDVITTSEKQKEYVESLFTNKVKAEVIPVSIPEYFKPYDKPKKPIVAIHTRNQGDAAKLAKSFYLQFPIYKWVTFKELRGLSREKFAAQLSESCVAVWIDDVAGFGTFPLEAIECNTPVIGKMPNMIPEWMEAVDAEGNSYINNNGVWTNTTLNIPELIATYMKVWLEDAVPQDLLDGIKGSQGKYTPEKQKTTMESVYENLVYTRTNELKITLEKLEESLLETTNA